MIPVWWFATGASVVFVAWVVFLINDGYSALDSVAPGVVAFVLGLAALMFIVAGLVISLGRHFNAASCHSFAKQTNRPTRFVVYNSWNTGDCLTPDGHGRWIPTKNLREFGDKS